MLVLVSLRNNNSNSIIISISIHSIYHSCLNNNKMMMMVLVVLLLLLSVVVSLSKEVLDIDAGLRMIRICCESIVRFIK